jgi:putative tricarboxylic transport membrane protein
MTTAHEPPPLTTGTLRAIRRPRWYTGRSELIIVGGVYALAVALTIGIVTMEVPGEVAFPGPQFFPTLVAILLYVVATALAVDILRTTRRTHVADDPTEISNDMLEDLGAIDATSEIRVVSPEDAAVPEPVEPARIDWRTLGITVAGLAGFILILPFAGWIVSAAALFWVISWAFGSRRPLLDIGIGVIISSIIQLAFGAGLGLTLPAGFLEGIAPWIS